MPSRELLGLKHRSAEEQKMFWRLTLSLRHPNEAMLDEVKLNEHREALAQHLKEPGTIVIDKLLVQCWGQKSR